MWGATGCRKRGTVLQRISIHAPRVGSDGSGTGSQLRTANFNPRSPCGERLNPEAVAAATQEFQSTLPVWGATISTTPRPPSTSYFNPRSPCGERLNPEAVAAATQEFQSTLPVWGATISTTPRPPSTSYFNPRSPCGERPGLRAERGKIHDFNPRSPCGERLPPFTHPMQLLFISIHAPRVGSDFIQQSVSLRHVSISIHAPRVGSDAHGFLHPRQRGISIHAPRVGSDFDTEKKAHDEAVFQSTLPVWGATLYNEQTGLIDAFQSTLPVWGATLTFRRNTTTRLFQSTLPVWGATTWAWQ